MELDTNGTKSHHGDNKNCRNDRNTFIFSLSSDILNKARAYTLSNWESITPSAQDMVYAGWWFTNIADRVICLYCDAMFHKWQETDMPYEIHSLKSPQCFFVRAAEQKSRSDSQQATMPSLTMNHALDGQSIVGALHADYAAIFQRTKTFQCWPKDRRRSLPSVESFAEAGFFYTGSIYLC